MRDFTNDKIRVGITQGDINGISYEVIIKTLSDNRLMDFCVPIVYGSPKVLGYHRKAINANNFNLHNIRDAREANPKRPNIINCVSDSVRVELGKSTDMAGEAAYRSLNKAVIDLQENKIDVLVTAPINKHNIQSDKFNFPGHTEYLGIQFNGDPLMLMVGETCRVGVATGHIPLSEVANKLSTELVLKKLRIMHQALKTDFAIRKPVIAVLGLNPHAGDNGLLGKEELEIITPAIENARKEKIMALGPFPADGLFGSSNFSQFDAILAMYHDQGLAPFKALEFEGGVNYTAGLSVVRTSPAHGTAYELAGKDQASENSFRKALYMALDIFRNRTEYSELVKDPLFPDEV